MFLGIPTDGSTTALITKYESDFFGTLELNKISTEVLETSLIEIISRGWAAAFEVKKVEEIVRDRTATKKKIWRVSIGRAHPPDLNDKSYWRVFNNTPLGVTRSFLEG
jgi:hypothetical protein